MMKFAVIAFMIAAIRASKAPEEPEQIHLSYGDTDAKTIVVTWSSKSKVDYPAVQFGICTDLKCEGSIVMRSDANATTEEFVDGGLLKSTQFIYRAWLDNLEPRSKYAYRCGSEKAWSAFYKFRTSGGSDWTPHVAVFGDLGYVNEQIVGALTNEVKNDKYDAIVNVGDTSYDFATDNGTFGDNFMNLIQPFVSVAPMMLCPGNHESAYNFSHYEARFTMLKRETMNHYYSFNLGPFHFVSISAEFYFFPQYYTDVTIRNQYEWLEQDLKTANLDANRNVRPWIVLYGHRPIYCSEADDSGALVPDCAERATLLRNGNASLPYGLDKLLFNYKVDVAMWGHVHFYERTWPIFNNTYWKPQSNSNEFQNPAATVHIINGVAGNRNALRNYTVGQEFSATGSSTYGYGHLSGNSTHLVYEQFGLVSRNETKVIDSFVLKRTKSSDVTTTTSSIGSSCVASYTLLIAAILTAVCAN